MTPLQKMGVLQKIGTVALGLAGLAYSACATPHVKPGTPYVKPSVVVEAEQPQPQIASTEKMDEDFLKLTFDTIQNGEPIKGNYHDMVVYGEVRNPRDCIIVKEYETSQGDFAVVWPLYPKHVQDMKCLKFNTTDPAIDVVLESLQKVAMLKWKFECSGLFPQEEASHIVLDDSTVLVPRYVGNSTNPMFERHYSWESVTEREQWRTGGPMVHPQYPITPKLEAMLAEAAEGLPKISESYPIWCEYK